MEKQEARRQVREAIARLLPDEREQKEAAIRGRLFALDAFLGARQVILYVTIPGEEIDTFPIIERLLGEGRRVFAPRVLGAAGEMAFCEVPAIGALNPGAFGILEPPDGHAAEPAEIDFVLVPGLGFDRALNRLGRGGGFYDRFLADPQLHAVKCALAYDCQILDELPHDAHDRPVDILVTESGVLARQADAC